MPDNLEAALTSFAKENKFSGKGPLCVALVVTKHARDKGLPLSQDDLVTEGGGQVLGLGKGAVQSILKTHGITKVLAAEGGRTSRGSLNNMRAYVAFLNELDNAGDVDIDAVESFWIERVQAFFAGKPFKLKLDASRSLRHVVNDLLSQAKARQKDASGTQYEGAVLQHLVGAKLDCALGEGQFEHNSYSTSDAQSGRAGDFYIGDVAIHVTTTPGEAVIERCKDNLDDGHKPLLVTTKRGVTLAEGLADNVGLGDRIDIFEIEQFVALNMYELGKFVGDGRKVAVRSIVERYNQIIDTHETDPSLKIDLK